MTAINENGQMYFTFEEIDLKGAIHELTREINEYRLHQSYWSNLYELRVKSKKNDMYYKNMCRCNDKAEKLIDIRFKLLILKNGGSL